VSLAARLRRWSLWPMLWKEFAQLRRDRFTIAMMVGIPIIQLILFGFAMSALATAWLAIHYMRNGVPTDPTVDPERCE